ncbi:MAG: hypothetical protein IKL00_01215 [Oscillospiraceae bacterium]|nr:hypothetical protein [Oscillospiraceae bacterium]
MPKAKKIVITVIAVLLVLALAAWFFVPRILLYAGSKAILSNIGEAATYFTEYDVRNEDVQTIDNGHIAIDIPKELVKNEKKINNLVIYQNTEKTKSVLLANPEDMSELNLLNGENMQEVLSSAKISIGMEQLRRGFEALGNGLPDCGYNTYKCIRLLDKEDNSFWNFNQAAAFLVAGTLKEMSTIYDIEQIYESDDICGFVFYSLRSNGTYRVGLEIYRTDDLNTVSTVMLTVENLEDAYAVMNSARASE